MKTIQWNRKAVELAIGEGAPRHEAKWLADFVISADFVKGTFPSTNPGLELSRKDRDAIERVVGVMEAQYLYYLGIATDQGFEDRELVAGLRAGGTAVDRGQAMASGGLR